MKTGNWKRFRAFGEKGILHIETTNSSIDGIRVLDGPKKDVPYITRSNINNGIARFVSDKNYQYGSNGAGSITVGLDTQTAFYQPHKFVTGQNIQIITGNALNNNTAHYLTTILKNQMRAKFNWGGNGATLTRMKRIEMLLPAINEMTPDWNYMSLFVETIKNKKLLQYKKYVEKQLLKLEYKNIPALTELSWSPFMISEVFHILPGIRLVAAHSSEGSRPFIGALDNNNGIARFVSDKNASLDKNVLGVNYNGNGMGIGFYHPYECIFTDDVKRFHLKHHEDNKFILLFMKVAILMQKQKFGYLYKFNANRMAHTKILLPVVNGEPDYAYMEQYAKNMMLRKYRQYLSYLEKRERNQKRDSGVIPNKRKRSFEEIDLDEDYSHDLWMERVKDAIAYRKAHGMIKEEGETPKVAPALSNDPVLADRPKLRAGWDDCDISDSAWERFVQKRENRSQKEK